MPILRTDTLSTEALYQFFCDCSITVENADLSEYTAKLTSLATTIEVWEDKELLAVCACYMNRPSSGVAYISQIVVHGAHRHRGIGRLLLTETARLAKEKGYRVLALEVHRGNAIAQALYRSFGFVETEQRPQSFLMNMAL